MNNLIGRFRVSVTTAKAPAADPLPARVAKILAIPADQRTPAQMATLFQLLANDRAGVEGGERRDRGAVAAVAGGRDDAHADSSRRGAEHERAASAAIFSSRPKPVTPGVPAFLHSLPGRRAADAADVCPLAGGLGKARRRRGCWSIACGSRISARALSARAKISGCKANRRRTRSCWIGWLASSWTAAGA